MGENGRKWLVKQSKWSKLLSKASELSTSDASMSERTGLLFVSRSKEQNETEGKWVVRVKKGELLCDLFPMFMVWSQFFSEPVNGLHL